MGEDATADECAMNYARAYAQRGLRGSPAELPQTISYPAPMAGDSGSTTRTLIIVAGLVAVAWLWFRSRKDR